MLIALWIVIGGLSGLVFYLAFRLAALQQSRQTSEAQYRIIFETVTDGLLINSLDGKVVEANPAACRMHGYTREEFLGQSAAEFVHPDSMHLFYEYVEALSSGQDFHCFAQDICKDGTVFDVEVNGIPFQFNQSLHLLGIVRDITKCKQTQDALKLSEELNRRIVEAVPAGIVHVLRNGAILKANTHAQKFLGLSLDQLTKQYVKDYESTSIYEDGSVCDPSDFPVSHCLLTGKKHGPLTLGVRRPDGTLAWAMFVAVPVHDPETSRQTGAIVTFWDITERKKAEQDLLESEERFRLLAENVPGAIFLCQNDERYTMLYLSDGVEKVTGYPKRAFLSNEISFVDLYHPEDRNPVRAEVKAALAERRPFRLRYRIKHQSGKYRWIEESGTGVWHDGELMYLEGVLDDVTEHVQAEKKLKQTQQQLLDQQQKETERVTEELSRVQNRLVQSTRLATIGKMAAQIAHEIRNPLGTIHNAAFYARRKLPESEKRALENMDRIQAEVAVCVNIIENILSITKIQPPRKTTLELGPFVADAFHRLRETMPDKSDQFQLDYEGHPEPLQVRVDRVQFRQVLDNLLKNAVEAMTDAGAIRIIARKTPAGTRIEISDTGPGVPESLAEKIFEVFQTTKAKGTGLGLGICREIIDHHGGTLTLARRANSHPQGATFIIRLPQEPGDSV